jgi:DNA-binding MarR family transcriptional regulator
VKRGLDKPLTRAERRRIAERQAGQEAELIDEIADAARGIAVAIGPNNEFVYRTDPVWRLLTTIEQSNYCCSLSDVGRLMKISRQHAQRLGVEAAHAGLVERAPNDDDRRIVQLLLTEGGRAEIVQARRTRSIWIARLLLGLDRTRMLAATHVVRVIRQRLAQMEREAATGDRHEPAARSSEPKTGC